LREEFLDDRSVFGDERMDVSAETRAVRINSLASGYPLRAVASVGKDARLARP
jgi:hypothetical protein